MERICDFQSQDGTLGSIPPGRANLIRKVAKLGIAPVLGTGGREFKSHLSEIAEVISPSRGCNRLILRILHTQRVEESGYPRPAWNRKIAESVRGSWVQIPPR